MNGSNIDEGQKCILQQQRKRCNMQFELDGNKKGEKCAYLAQNFGVSWLWFPFNVLQVHGSWCRREAQKGEREAVDRWRRKSSTLGGAQKCNGTTMSQAFQRADDGGASIVCAEDSVGYKR